MHDFQQTWPWLHSDWLQLAKTITQQRIPQALLITGNKGLGKFALAQHFAQSLLCFTRDSAADYCGQCQSCRLFQAETHPDYKIIEPEQAGKSITIAMIRELTTQLSLKPQFESQRVVVINPADSLNNAAANAFLKYLEEPTERTTLLLITEKPTKLPATIRSRCQKLLISCPGESVLKAWLEQHNAGKNSETVMRLSQGSPLLAKQLSDRAILALRAQCFSDWVSVGCAKTNANELAGQWYKLDRDELAFLLFWLTSWVMDMITLAYHRQALNVYNPDLIEDLQELTEKLDLKSLYKYYDFLLRSQKTLDTPLNKQLMWEEILIKWTILNNRE